MTSQALIAAFTLLAFGIIVAGVAFGSAIGDGIVASKAVEAIARQPEARPNIFTFLFLGVGVLEAFPIIALGLAFYMLIVVVGLPNGVFASSGRTLAKAERAACFFASTERSGSNSSISRFFSRC